MRMALHGGFDAQMLVIHLLDVRLQLTESVDEAEGRARPPGVPAHPRLDVVHVFVDFVHDVIPRDERVACLCEVIGGD